MGRGKGVGGMWKVYCTHCGHGNVSQYDRCGRCGAQLVPLAVRQQAGPPPLDVPTATLIASEALAGGDEPLHGDTGELVAALAPGTGMLVITRGRDAGSHFLLDSDVVTVGRHPDSGIVLDDVTVSRRHAEVLRGPEAFLVRDVGSLNGTYVNREPVTESVLATGDELRVGTYVFAFLAARDRDPEQAERGWPDRQRRQRRQERSGSP